MAFVLLGTLLAARVELASALSSTVTVEGKIESKFGGVGLSVELRPMTSTSPASPVLLEHDGSFRLRDVADGSYVLLVKNALGDVVAQQFVDVAGFPATLSLRLNEAVGSKASPPGMEATVAMGTLAHPPSDKSVKLVQSALRLSSEGKHERAAVELEKAIALSSDFAGAHTNLGAQYLFLKRYADAARELEESIRIGPSSTAFANLSFACLMLNRQEDAEFAARRAIVLDPSNARSHLQLGSVLAEQPAARVEAIRELRLAAPHVPSAYRMLVRLYLDAGEPAAAEEMRRLAEAAER